MSYIYGNETSETLDSSASTAGDNISGSGGDDTIIGSAFDDSIDGGEGSDSITAGSGNDTISGGYGSDTIFGEAGDDYFEIYGDASDSINGGDGADKFIIQSGEFGFHTLTGGIGSDTYVLPDFYSKTITITDFAAGASGDILDVTNLLKNSYNLSSNPFSSSYLRLFTSGSDTLLQWDQDGLGNEYQASWKTIAILQNTTAANFVAANFAPQIPTNGSAVTGIETITGTTGNDQLTGGIGNNSITGLAGDDNLTGLFGNDTLIGGVGQDNLTGGAGNDSLIGGESGTNADDSGNYLYGGDGNDTLVGGDFGASGDNLDGGRGDDNLSGLLGDDSLNGGEGNDTLSGGIGNDYFTDEAGNNSISGGDGNDIFDITSTGLNSISGGAGADLYLVHSGNQFRITDFDSADIFDISELLNANRGDTSGNPFNPTNGYFRLIQDTVVPTNVIFQWDIDGTTSTAKTWQTVITFENKTVANFADTNFSPLIPLNGSDVAGVSLTLTTSGTLKGNVGNDTLTGGTSNNTLYGFAGSDTLIGNDGYDNLYGGQGNDLVVGGVSGTNADTSGNYLYGQDGDDTLIGSDYAGQGDRLDGGNGNDSLVGGAGNDTLDGGGKFSDSTLGVDGNDTLDGGLGNDRLYSRGGNDLLSGGDGNDYFDLDFRDNISTFTTLVGGLGDDTFDLSHLRHNYNPSMGGTAPTRNVTITGGTGIDKFLINSSVENVVINDFEVGNPLDTIPGGDLIDITPLLNESIGNYSGNPFGSLGYFQLIQSGADTLFQWDKDGAVGSANTWKTVFTFVGVTSGITAANFIPSIPTDGTTIPTGVSLTATNISGETVNGNIGNDTLIGSDGYDVLHGFAGNDSIIAGNGYDNLYGGQGNDTLVGGVAGTNADTDVNYLHGGEGNDVLYAGANGGGLYGENGNDSLIGFTGNDDVNGGFGNDTLLGGDGNDTLSDEGGSNSIDGGTGNDTFTVYSENATDSSTLTGGAGSDRFILSTGNLGSLSITDFAVGASGDILDIEEIINSSIGYSGGNLFGSQGYLRLEPSGTGDTLFQWDKDGATGSVNTWQTLVTLTGITATNVTLDNFSTPMSPTGTAVSGQVLTGTINNDVLHGNVGNDTITGNGGFDQLSGSGGNDLITGSGYLRGDAGDDFITAIVSTYSYGEIIINDVQGGTGYDTLIGSTGDDNFYDYSGSNSIDGGAGNDTFDIASDNATDISTITGGAGSDKFYVSAYSLSAPVVTDFTVGIGGDVINVNSLLTRNTTYTSAAGDPFGSVGYLRVMQNGVTAQLQWDKDGAAGSTDSWVTVLTLNNVSAISLIGANFTGTIGTDFAGVTSHVPTLNVLPATQNIAESTITTASVGTIDVQDLDFANSEHVIVQVSNNIGITSTGSNASALQTLLGSQENQSLLFNALDLTATGAGFTTSGATITLAENKTLNYSFNVSSIPNFANLLSGDSITLSYIVNAEDENLNLASQTLNFTVQGETQIISAVVIPADVDTPTAIQIGTESGTDIRLFEGVTDVTNKFNQTSDIDASGIRIITFTVNPTSGYNGTKSLVAKSFLIGDPNTVQSTSTSLNLTLPDGDDNLVGTTGNDTLFGGAGNDALFGLFGNDSLDGGEGNDSLEGGEGFDTLIGGAGSDTLSGGFGSDVYVIGDIADVIIEFDGEGDDTVHSTVTYTLSTNVEDLYLDGAAAIGGTGNAGSNNIHGNDAANTLDDGDTSGSAVVNTLWGGKGNDIYVVHSSGTLVMGENNVGGVDTIQHYESGFFELPRNIENLELVGGSFNFGRGNNLANSITGSASTDTLDGGAGADTLTGGAGEDTYIIDRVTDQVIESASAGTDTVQSIVTYTLPVNVENLDLTGLAAISGTGNSLDNVINGNNVANMLAGGDGADVLNGMNGNDSLDGGVGADTLIGGMGVDTLTGGTEADTFTFLNISEMGIATRRDVITDFTTGTDKIDLSAMNIVGSAGTGALADMFTIRWTFYGGYAVVQGDTNEDPATVDFEIKLNGVTALADTDFIFAPILVTGAGSGDASVGNVRLQFAEGTYDYSISNFGAGDALIFPDYQSPTLTNTISTDGNVIVEWASAGSVMAVTLTGLTNAQDSAIFDIPSFNSVFGAGSII